MGAFDYLLLALTGAYAAFVMRRLRKKSGCGGDCGACSGCARTKEQNGKALSLPFSRASAILVRNFFA